MRALLGSRSLCLAAWGLAVVGYWAPWLPGRAAALQLNAYELAEWVSFLPDVRDGSARVGRLTFLIPLSVLSVLGILVGLRWKSRRAWTSALFALVALAFGLAVLPPYPSLLHSLTDPELRPQVVLALVTLAGAVAAVPIATRAGGTSAGLAILLSLLGLYFSVRAVEFLRLPYERLLGEAFRPGWGWAAMVLGMSGTIAGEVLGFLRRPPKEHEGPRDGAASLR